MRRRLTSPASRNWQSSTILRQSGANLVALVLTSVAGILALGFGGDEAFTHYAQALAATSIGHLVVTQRLEVLLLSGGGEHRAEVLRRLRRTAAPSIGAIALVCLLAFFILGSSTRTLVLLLIPPIIAVHGLTEVLSAERASDKSYAALASNRLLFGVALIVAVPVSVAISATGVALLIADLVARSIALVPLLGSGDPLASDETASPTVLDVPEFRRTFLPAAAVSVVSIALIPLVGPALFRPERIAAYLVVYRIASSLAGAVGRAVALIVPVMMSSRRTDLDREYRLGFLRGSATGGVLAAVGFVLLFTSWRAYGTSSLALAPWLFAVGVAQVSAAHFVARRWFSQSLLMTTVDAALTCLGLAVGWIMGSMTLGLGLYGLSAVASAVFFRFGARQREAA